MIKSQFYFNSFFLDTLSPPDSGIAVHGDLENTDLKIWITARGVKTFFIRKRVRGIDQRFVIGHYPKISVDEARERATQLLISFSKKTRAPKAKTILFQDLVKRFADELKKNGSPRWAQTSRALITKASVFTGYQVNLITEEQVSDLVNKIRDDSGLFAANRILEHLRSLFKFAIKNNFAEKNPAITAEKFTEPRRNRIIRPTEWGTLMAAIDEEKSASVKNLFKMLCFTGAGKADLLAMRWADIDMNFGSWRANDHDYPLSDRAAAVLEHSPQSGEFVFPSPRARGHFVDPKRAWARILARARLENLRISDIAASINKSIARLAHSDPEAHISFEKQKIYLNEVVNGIQ